MKSPIQIPLIRHICENLRWQHERKRRNNFRCLLLPFQVSLGGLDEVQHQSLATHYILTTKTRIYICISICLIIEGVIIEKIINVIITDYNMKESILILGTKDIDPYRKNVRVLVLRMFD